MNWSLFQNTLLIGSAVTLTATVLGLLVALVMMSGCWRLRWSLLGLSVVTLVLPPFLLTNTWLHYLGAGGVWQDLLPLDLFSPAGVVLILSLWLWPIPTLAAWSAWQRLEPAHLEAEPGLRGVAMLRFLLLPMARGPLVVAGLITFVLAANNLAVPALLQVKVYPAEVWVSFSSTFWVKADGSFDVARALSLTWPLILLPLVLIVALSRFGFPWPTLNSGCKPQLFRRSLGSLWLSVSAATTLFILVLSVGLPAWQIAGSTETWTQLPSAVAAGKSAILNSAGIAAGVGLICVVLAVISVLLASRKRITFSGKCRQGAGITWGSMLWVPFLVPGVLVGIALIQLLNRPMTAWFYQSLGVVVLALTIRYIAIGWSIARHAWASTDPELSDAAMLDGASRWQLFRHVLWPQIAPQLAVAWCIVFLLCLWDVETLVLIIPPGGETMALRIFNLLHYGHAAHVNALCLALLGMAVAPLLCVAAFVNVRRLLFSRRRVHVFANVATGSVALFLLAGCSPELAPNEARVNSQLFDRVQIIATRGVAPGQVNKPRSVAVDHEDNLFVLDFTGRVQKFSPDGEFLLFWQMPEVERGNPKGLSMARDGNIIVVEPHYSRLNLFTLDGELLMQWGEHGTNRGQFSFPRSCVVNSKNEWFVSEFGRVDRVQKFSGPQEKAMQLTFMESFGNAGARPGEYNRPEGLFAGDDNQVLVADAVNHRVQVLDSNGAVIRTYGEAGSAAGELSYPYDICVDDAERHFVCEFGNSRIQIFSSKGQSLEILGGPGAAPGFFNNPWGVALDSRGNLYVADSQNHRVQKFLRKPKLEVKKSGIINHQS